MHRTICYSRNRTLFLNARAGWQCVALREAGVDETSDRIAPRTYARLVGPNPRCRVDGAEFEAR